MVLEGVRDVAIIVLAVESLVIGGLLVVLLWQLWKLVRLLEEEVKPLLDSANETMSTMRNTTSFVSENVVSPVVRIHTFVAGVKGAANALRRPRRERRREGRRAGGGDGPPDEAGPEGPAA